MNNINFAKKPFFCNRKNPNFTIFLTISIIFITILFIKIFYLHKEKNTLLQKLTNQKEQPEFKYTKHTQEPLQDLISFLLEDSLLQELYFFKKQDKITIIGLSKDIEIINYFVNTLSDFKLISIIYENDFYNFELTKNLICDF